MAKMKKTILFLMVFIAVFSVKTLSEESMVYVVNLNYKEGAINFKEITFKTGYYPDNKLASGDYRIEVVSNDNTVLYSFNFDVPLKIYTDVIEKGEISGNVILLNETDFAVIVPYFENAKEIAIYKMNAKEVSIPVKETPSPKKNWIGAALVAVFVLLIFIIILRKIKKKNITGDQT